MIDELDGILQTRNAGFSIRSADSMAKCIKRYGDDTAIQVLDVVLAQEVLTKIRLHAGEESDLQFVEALAEWGSKPGRESLRLSRGMFHAWRQTLNDGRDVFQA